MVGQHEQGVTDSFGECEIVVIAQPVSPSYVYSLPDEKKIIM